MEGRRDRVTFVAELRHLLTDQQMAIHTAVRHVTPGTSFVEDGRMLEDVRPLEFHVAAEALAIAGGPEKPRRPPSVHLVAIPARDQPTIDPMAFGKGELGADLQMAAVA